MLPFTLAPLIITLFWAEQKAKRLGLVEKALKRSASGYAESARTRVPVMRRIWNMIDQLDLVGLTVLGAAVALILLPLTLSQTAKGGWHNGMSILVLWQGILLIV